MPLYEYFCREHGTQIIIQEMNEEHNAICGLCNTQMRRIYSAPSIKIKGVTPKLGKVRGELFSNLEKEGLAPRDFANYDKHTYFDNQIEVK